TYTEEVHAGERVIVTVHELYPDVRVAADPTEDGLLGDLNTLSLRNDCCASGRLYCVRMCAFDIIFEQEFDSHSPKGSGSLQCDGWPRGIAAARGGHRRLDIDRHLKSRADSRAPLSD